MTRTIPGAREYEGPKLGYFFAHIQHEAKFVFDRAISFEVPQLVEVTKGF
jgi:hypothetical protein